MSAPEEKPVIFTAVALAALAVAHPVMGPARTTLRDGAKATFEPGPALAIDLTLATHAGPGVTLRIADARTAKAVGEALNHACAALEYALRQAARQPLPAVASPVRAQPCNRPALGGGTGTAAAGNSLPGDGGAR